MELIANFNLARHLLPMVESPSSPTITLFPELGRAEGLMAYGPNLLGTWRQVGVMIGKVLQGTQPADLPIERPTEFELVINIKTAKALGLKVPLSLQASADEVID